MISRQARRVASASAPPVAFQQICFAHMWNASLKANEALLGANQKEISGGSGKGNIEGEKASKKFLRPSKQGRV